MKYHRNLNASITIGKNNRTVRMVVLGNKEIQFLWMQRDEAMNLDDVLLQAAIL